MEDLKSVWQAYDKKVQSAQAISEKIIESMIRERSFSRVSRIKRQSHVFFAILLIEIVALVAVFLGNPFDFKHGWQFIPFVFVLIGVILAFFNLWQIYRKINNNRSHHSIEMFLKNILDTYEKNKIFERWFGVVFLSLGALLPLSFLPNKLARMSWGAALLDVAIMISMTLIFYFLAFRFGAFKNRHEENFRNDLLELNELKSIMVEIQEN